MPYSFFLKIILLQIALLLLIFQGVCQKKQRNQTDPHSIPKALKRKVKILINNDTSETEKLLSICKWICKHKRYDTKGFEEIRVKNYSIQKIWNTKRLLCREYTRLLQAMCQEAGLKCFTVEGYTKSIYHYPYKPFYYEDHEWNVIKEDSTYRILDLTWASGYIKPKVSPIGRIKLLLNIPYIPRHWKFVRKLNMYYFDIPPEELLETHLPVHPMWQLSAFPITIQQYENENIKEKDSSSTPYPYRQRIAMFDALSDQEKLLLIAEEGYQFNTKNNYHMGAGYLRYAYNDWESFYKKEIPATTKIICSNEVKKYAEKGEKYLRSFLQDNQRINQKLRDSLRTKHSEVRSFISKNSRFCKRKVNEKNLAIRRNIHHNKMADLAIALKENEKYRNTNSDPIYKARRTIKKTPENYLEQIRSEIQKNDEFLDSLQIQLPDLKDTLHSLSLTKRVWMDSILRSESLKNDLIAYASKLDLLTNNKYYLRPIHSSVDSLQTQINTYEKEFKTIEAIPLKKILRYRDSISYVAIKKIAQSKRLLVRYKALSNIDNDEERMYEEQNDKQGYWYDQHKKTLENYKKIRNENNVFFKKWERQLKATQRALRRYLKYEVYVYRIWLKHEHYRFKVYRSAGNNGILHCILLKRKANVMINTCKKLEKKRQDTHR